MTHSRIGFQSVSKFYFVWLYLFVIHFLLFFYLPIVGNLKLSGGGNNAISYCDKNNSKMS